MTPPLRVSLAGLLPGRKRADAFAAALDGRQPAAVGVTLGADLQPLVRVAAALRAVEPVQPRPEHTTELRARLMAEAQTLLGPQMQKLRVPPRPKGVRERRLVAAATAVLVVGGTAGVATASQTALPGQALYPVKRSIEQAQEQIASTPAGKGRLLLAQADDRLQEVAGLITDPSASSTEISATVQDFTGEARDGTQLLLGAFRTGGDRGSVDAVRVFAAHSLHRLETLAPDAPPSSKPAFASAAVMLRNLDAQAQHLCTTCAADLPALQVSQLLLTRAEVDRALHDARSQHLDNSHPVVVQQQPTDGGQASSSTGSRTDPHRSSSSGGGQALPGAPAPSTAPEQSGSDGGVGNGLKNLLPGKTPTGGPSLGGSVGQLGGSVGQDLTNTLQGTVDGLTGAATTLLPDPGSGGGGLLP